MTLGQNTRNYIQPSSGLGGKLHKSSYNYPVLSLDISGSFFFSGSTAWQQIYVYSCAHAGLRQMSVVTMVVVTNCRGRQSAKKIAKCFSNALKTVCPGKREGLTGIRSSRGSFMRSLAWYAATSPGKTCFSKGFLCCVPQTYFSVFFGGNGKHSLVIQPVCGWAAGGIARGFSPVGVNCKWEYDREKTH